VNSILENHEQIVLQEKEMSLGITKVDGRFQLKSTKTSDAYQEIYEAGQPNTNEDKPED